MKKTIKFLSTIGLVCLVLLSIALAFPGSKNSSISPQVSGESLIMATLGRDDSNSDDLFLISEVVQTKYEASVSSVSLQGNLTTVDEGRIYLNERSYGVKRGSLYWSTANDTGSTDDVLGCFGRENTFSLDGAPITRGFYVPKPLKLGFENAVALEFKRDEGIKLSWNADERNEYPVVVVLQYVSDDDKGLVTKQFSYSDREGGALISPDELREFPSDSNLILYAGRGNGKSVTVRDKTTSLAGITITTVPGIVLR